MNTSGAFFMDQHFPIFKHIKKYQDTYGLVHDKPGTICSNPVLFTAEVVYGLRINDLWAGESYEKYRHAVGKCVLPSGLPIRHPEKLNETYSHDELIGHMLFAKVSGPYDMLKKIDRYAHTTWPRYFLDSYKKSKVVNPFDKLSRKGLIVRHVVDMAALNIMLGRDSWKDHKVIDVALSKDADRYNQDHWLLNRWIAQCVGWPFEAQIRRVWPDGGLGACLKSYFTGIRVNPMPPPTEEDHPAVWLLWGRY